MPGTGRSRNRTGRPPLAGRRQALLEAITDHVFANGLRELSVRSMAGAVGVSHRTLLYHFESKEQLLDSVLREARARERLLIAAQLGESEGTAFVDLMRRTWRRSLEHLPFFRVYYEVHGMALEDPERHAAFLNGVVDDWVELIDGALQREGVYPDRSETLATLIWSALRGLHLDVLATGDVERVDAAFEELAAVVARELEEATAGASG